MLQLPAWISFGVQIRGFLQLERPLARDGIVNAAPEEEEVLEGLILRRLTG